MRKLLNNKLLMMPLVIVLTVSAAMFAFAPSGIKADPNKGLPFKAVKFCVPRLVQMAIQKIVKGMLSAAVSVIPYIGSAIAEAIQNMPDDKIPVPCGCQAKENLYDSAPTPMDVKDNPFDFLGKFPVPGLDYNLTQSTQKDLEAKLTKELVPKWEEAQKQQAAMVKKGTPDGPDVFMTAFNTMRKGLAQANALSYAANFEDEFKKRYPNMSANIESMSDAERRMAEGWRQVMDAWMKALNVAGLNFDEEQKVRTALAHVILKAYDDSVYEVGQTHMIQYIGALVAQENGVAARMEAEWDGFVEMCISCMETELELDESALRNVTEIAKDAANFKPSTGNHNLGF